MYSEQQHHPPYLCVKFRKLCENKDPPLIKKESKSFQNFRNLSLFRSLSHYRSVTLTLTLTAMAAAAATSLTLPYPSSSASSSSSASASASSFFSRCSIGHKRFASFDSRSRVCAPNSVVSVLSLYLSFIFI